MGWLFAFGFALITGSLLFLVARPGKGVWEMVAAALMIGIAGYAWQGTPSEAGAPRDGVKTAAPFNEEIAAQRRSMGERMDDSSKWMMMSDGLARAGETEDAANVILSGLNQYPNDPNLWTGMGNALVAHANGLLSPAAEYSFQQAMKRDPDAPGPRYFYGLALAQSGEFGRAKALWSALLVTAPEGSAWRKDLESNLAMLDQAMAGQQAAP